MGKSISVVGIKNRKTGIVRYHVRTITNRKSTKKSLGIKLTLEKHTKYFIKDKQRFREQKSFPEGLDYNTKIEKYLSTFNNDIITDYDNQKSFIVYFQNKIDAEFNHGTRIKKKVVLNKLKKYIEHQNKKDLYFDEITKPLVSDLLLHFKTAKDPRRLTNNSAIHYLKIIKSIFNDSQKDDVYQPKSNPFSNIILKQNKLKSKYLNSEELSKLTESQIQDDKLLIVRNIFLFSLFASGMRISDVLTLRWKNFRNGRLEYTMMKNKTEVDLSLTPYLCILLSEVYSDFPKYKDSKNDLEITVKFKDVDKSKIMSLNEIEEAINEHKFNVSKNPKANKVVQEILEGSLESEGHLINYLGYKIDTNNTQVKYLIDRKHKLLSLIDDNFLKDFILYLKKYKEKRKDDFVFPFLDKKVFDNNRDELLSEKEYKHIKNKSIVYNRKLKLIQKQLDIETNLTSHVARHSFANFLLELGNVSIYDISKLMRHASLQITEQYLRRNFDPQRLDDLNFTLQDKYRAKY